MNHLVVTILACNEDKYSNIDVHEAIHFPNVLNIYKEKLILATIIETIRELGPKKIIVVTGKFHTMIIQTLAKHIDIFGIHFVKQVEPLGSGYSIKCCLHEYESQDKVLIINGDISLITSDILRKFMAGSRGSCNVLAARVENPSGYDRIIYDKDGDFTEIIEEMYYSDCELGTNIIHCGIYYVDGFILTQFVPLISNNNLQNEFHLTDIVKTVKNKSWNVVDAVLLDALENDYILDLDTYEK